MNNNFWSSIVLVLAIIGYLIITLPVFIELSVMLFNISDGVSQLISSFIGAIVGGGIAFWASERATMRAWSIEQKSKMIEHRRMLVSTATSLRAEFLAIQDSVQVQFRSAQSTLARMRQEEHKAFYANVTVKRREFPGRLLSLIKPVVYPSVSSSVGFLPNLIVDNCVKSHSYIQMYEILLNREGDPLQMFGQLEFLLPRIGYFSNLTSIMLDNYIKMGGLPEGSDEMIIAPTIAAMNLAAERHHYPLVEVLEEERRRGNI